MQNSTTWCNLFLTASKFNLAVKPPIKLWVIVLSLSVVLTWSIWQLPIVQLLFWQQLTGKLLLSVIPFGVSAIAFVACRQEVKFYYLDPQQNNICYQQQTYQIGQQSKVSVYFCYLVLVDNHQQSQSKHFIWRQGCQPAGYAMLARMIRATSKRQGN